MYNTEFVFSLVLALAVLGMFAWSFKYVYFATNQEKPKKWLVYILINVVALVALDYCRNHGVNTMVHAVILTATSILVIGNVYSIYKVLTKINNNETNDDDDF